MSYLAQILLNGENRSEDKGLLEVGVKIMKEITKNYRYPTAPITTDGGGTNSTNASDATNVKKIIVVQLEVPKK